MWWEQMEQIAYFPPPHHLYGLLFGIGKTVILAHASDPGRAEAEMAAAGATALWLVPPYIRLYAEQEAPPPPGLRIGVVRTGAAAIPQEIVQTIERRYGARLVQEYGTMETGRLMCTAQEEMPAESIGTPYPGVEVRLVDEDGRDVPEGDVGELLARTPGMMLGYLDDPLATARAIEDGWFHTGDLARRDADGCYYLVGRTTLRINVGGQKVSPEEVEAVLEQHPAVREAAVFAKADAARGEVVWAAVVLSGPAPTEQELRHFCRERLEGYKVPRGFDFHDALPHSFLGKVLRQRLS
jgi:long-chain acyl-CoA synthetase